jgi:hypothetical protein
MRRRVGGGGFERCIAPLANRRIFFLEPLLVGDGLLLDVFDVQRPPPAIVAVEDVGRRFVAENPAEQAAKLDASWMPKLRPSTPSGLLT